MVDSLVIDGQRGPWQFLKGVRDLWEMRAGPWAPMWRRADKTPQQSARECTSLQGWQERLRGSVSWGAARWHLLSGDGSGTCLDLPHFIGLELRSAVVVNETNTAHQLGWRGSRVRARGTALPTLQTPPLIPIRSDTSPPSSVPSTLGSPPRRSTHSHSDGHVSLCHSVHGGGDQRRLQRDLPSQS